MIYIIKTTVFLLFFSTFIFSNIDIPMHKITFLGDKHFSKEVLEDALGVKNRSSYQFWMDDNPIINNKLIPSLESSLKSFYQSEGFYDSIFVIEKRDNSISVRITANQPILIDKIKIFSDYNFKEFILLKRGDRFNARTFISIKNNIIKKLLKNGYCSYDLDTKAFVDLVKHKVDFKFNLKKGKICTFGKTIITGLKTINNNIIKSRIRAIEGARFNSEVIQETANNLHKLNSFDTVLIDITQKINNVIPIDITLKEKEKPYHLEVGVGYDTYVGARVKAEIIKYNFLANAQQIKLEALLSQHEELIKVSYYKPSFLTLFNYNIDLGTEIGYGNLEFNGFKEKKSFSQLYGEYNDGKIQLKIGISLENIIIHTLDNIKKGKILTQAVNEGEFVLLYPHINFVYDHRNSKLNPKHGYYFSVSSELGLSNDREASVYLKSLFEARSIYTFSGITLSAVGKIGVIDTEGKQNLPESKYFFGGGSYSNRAYGYNQLGVISSNTQDTIYGASSLVNLSLEANYPFTDSIYGAIFSDNTMLNRKSFDFKGNIITSAGVGFRYVTPIGPFKVDIGFNVNDLSIYGIQFQIGQSF